MKVTILTLFPEVFKPFLKSSILAKAQEKGKLEVSLLNLRRFGLGPHRQVDDRVYGGGVGMILRIEPLAKAIAKAKSKNPKAKTILLSPTGKKFDQKMARKLARQKHLILVCGKYEGVDARVEELVDEQISIGDYVLTGGEMAAMVVTDAVSRLLPGVLKKEATSFESFSTYPLNSKPYTLLEPPQYTRPEVFKGRKVPKILLSGDHQKIAEWRKKEALRRTRKLRPDLLKL